MNVMQTANCAKILAFHFHWCHWQYPSVNITNWIQTLSNHQFMSLMSSNELHLCAESLDMRLNCKSLLYENYFKFKWNTYLLLTTQITKIQSNTYQISWHGVRLPGSPSAFILTFAMFSVKRLLFNIRID